MVEAGSATSEALTDSSSRESWTSFSLVLRGSPPAPSPVAADTAALEMAALSGPPWWGRLENQIGKTRANGLSHPLTSLLPATAAGGGRRPNRPEGGRVSELSGIVKRTAVSQQQVFGRFGNS